MDDAGAALRGVATDMRSGESEMFAEELHQQGARFDISADGFPVHRHRYGRHPCSPVFGPVGPLFLLLKLDLVLTPAAPAVKGVNAAASGHFRREILEKLVGDLLSRPVHETLTELGKLAADLRFYVVGEQRAAVLVGERNGRAA